MNFREITKTFENRIPVIKCSVGTIQTVGVLTAGNLEINHEIKN